MSAQEITKNTRALRLVSLVAWFLALAIPLAFFLSTIFPRTQTIETDFRTPSRIVSALGPPTRVGTSSATGTELVGEPVYFSVRVPPCATSFSITAHLTVPEQVTPSFGVVLEPYPEQLFADEQPQFALTPLTKIDDATWQGRASFVGVPRIGNVARVFFSLPGVSSSASVVMHDVRIETSRSTLRAMLGSLLQCEGRTIKTYDSF